MKQTPPCRSVEAAVASTGHPTPQPHARSSPWRKAFLRTPDGFRSVPRPPVGRYSLIGKIRNHRSKMDTWLGRLALTAPFPLKRSMHLSTPPVNDPHHIGNLGLSDISGTLLAKIP